MTGLLVSLVGLLVLVAIGAWLSWTAARLDQLHHRIGLGRESLRIQLALRSGMVLELAGSGSLDDATSLLLADAARRARRTTDRQAESDLSRSLRAAFEPATVTALREEEAGRELAVELAAACRKVELARRFLNDQVTSGKALRSRRRVRWFALAGRAPEPVMVDIDDVAPQGLDGT